MKKVAVRAAAVLLTLAVLLGAAGPVSAAGAGGAKAAALEQLRSSLPAKGYAGDRSRLTLTVDQARQIISTLQNWYMSDYQDMAGTEEKYAYLVDAEGTGVPVLGVTYIKNLENFGPEGREEIYTWQGGRLSRAENLMLSYRISMGVGPNLQGGYSWFEQAHDYMADYATVYRVSNGRVVEADLTREFIVVDFDGFWDISLNGELMTGMPSDGNFSDYFHQYLDRYGYPYQTYNLYEQEIGVPFSSLIGPLQTFIEDSQRPEYSLPVLTDADPQYSKVTGAASSLGQVVTVYQISDDRCFVLLKNAAGYRTVVVKGSISGGQEVWTPSDATDPPADVAPLLEEAAKAKTVLNISLDTGDIANLATAEDAAKYIQERLDNVDGLAPTIVSKVQLAAFARGWLAEGPSATVSSGDNQLTIIPDTFSSLLDTAKKNCSTVQDVFVQNGVSAGQTFTTKATVLWKDADVSAQLWIFLDGTLAGTVQDTPLRILLGDASHFIEFPAGSIERLVSQYGEMAVRFTPEESGAWSVMFITGEESIPRLPVAVTLGLPAGSAIADAVSLHDDTSDSLGGQYDSSAGAVFFDTRSTGTYAVQENAPSIADADSVSNWCRDSVDFLLARGWLTADEGSFKPGDPLTRYEAALALAGMTFALDGEQEQSFADVPADSPYSTAVASAAASGLISGISDTEFGGDQNITNEQLLTLLARVLTERAGFKLPENPDEILEGSPDRDAVAGWAKQQTALAVQAGIIAAGGTIAPKETVTRERAAAMLVRTFNLVKAVPPVPVNLPDGSVTVTGGESKELPRLPEEHPGIFDVVPVWVFVVIAFAAGAAVSAAAVLLAGRKKKGKKQEAAPATEQENTETKS